MLSIPLLNIIASFIVAAFITWYSIPKIIKVVRIKKLYDEPGDRKVHETRIPTLGGIGIFGGFFIAMLLFVNGNIEHLSIICASLMFIFFMGQKDDLINMPPYKKLIIEIMAALLVAVTTDLRFTTLQGFMGIGVLPFWLSVVFTVFVVVFIMNAFNLIDGIDGLAASIGVFAAVIFGVWFWIAGDIGFTVMAAAIAGALCAFLPYNFDKGRLKIFMGDTGSLTVGFLLAILAIHFSELNAVITSNINFNSAPAIVLGVLMLPLFDSIRVSLVRIGSGKHPFHGDNNHLHHRLLRLGWTHYQATLILVTLNALFVVLAMAMDGLGTNAVIVILAMVASMLSFISLKLENRQAYRKSQGEMPQVVKAYYKKTG